jgi:hypothetical protein
MTTPENTSLADAPLVHHVGMPCNRFGTGDTATDWDTVTCGLCRLEKPKDRVVVHHADVNAYCDEVPYGQIVVISYEWDTVTCGACRLEMPEDMTGRREYRIPAEVSAMDASLAARDRQLARLDAAIAETAEKIEIYAKHAEDLQTLRDAIAGYGVRPLSVPLSAVQGSGVPEVTPESAEPLRNAQELSPDVPEYARVAEQLTQRTWDWLKGPSTMLDTTTALIEELIENKLMTSDYGLTPLGSQVRNYIREIS